MDYLILLSSILAGAFTVLVFRLEQRSFIKLFSAFTGGYLLTLTFLHMLPELYEGDSGHQHAHYLIGSLILAGFFVQVILDSISLGVEHGHSHHLHAGVPIGVVIGLCLHAFVEALALGKAGGAQDTASRRMLMTSIVIHNYPVTIALLGMLLHAGLTRRKSLALVAVFAVMAPLGMGVSSVTELAHHTRELTAIVIGIFMHISTTILFESSDGHRFNLQKIMAITLGTGLGVLTVVLH